MIKKESDSRGESLSIPIEDDKNETDVANSPKHKEHKTECLEIGLDVVIDSNERCTNLFASASGTREGEDYSFDCVQVDNISNEIYTTVQNDPSGIATDNKDQMQTVEINNETVILRSPNNLKVRNENKDDDFEKEGTSNEWCLYEGYGILNKSFSTSTMEMNITPYYELNKRSSYIYPVIVDNIEITSKGATAKSTSLPDISSRISVMPPTQKNCSCDCHSNHSNKSSNSNRRSFDTPSYYDVIATPSHHKNCYANDLILDLNQLRGSPSGTPGNTPGKVRRNFPSQMVKMFNSRNPSPTSTTKGLPNYRSLIFSILKDEPPKYEDVTGKKLADELIGYGKDDRPTQPPGPGFVRNALKRRLIGIAALLVVIMFTFIVLYLSATIVGKRNSNVDRKASGTNGDY